LFQESASVVVWWCAPAIAEEAVTRHTRM
jgi:hypothetical protein